jgi:hypothetical protein
MPPTIRLPSPSVDDAILQESMSRYVREVGCSKAFDLGVYAGIPIGNGVRGRGLLYVSSLICMLLESAAHLIFTHLGLKGVIVNVAYAIPGLWPDKDRAKGRPIDRWASDIAERLFCICNHLRRVKHSSVRHRQCMADLSTEEQDRLQQLLDKVIILDSDSRPPACKSPSTSVPAAASSLAGSSGPELADNTAASSSGSRGHPAPPPESNPDHKKARVLQKEVSLCSVDSDGFPNMLKSLHSDPCKDDATVFYASAETDANCSPNDFDEELLEVEPIPARKCELKAKVYKKPAGKLLGMKLIPAGKSELKARVEKKHLHPTTPFLFM